MTGIALCFLSLTLQQNGFEGPSGERPKGPPGRSKGWTVEGRAEGGLTYNSNVWLLDGGQQDRLEADLPADGTSGRFDDMESVDDLLFEPDLRVEAKGPGLLGKRADVFFDLEYPVYTRNPRRSHLVVGAGAGHAVSGRGHLELSVRFIPDYFRKNYLSDGLDADGDGDISSSERRYEDGTYSEAELGLEYRHKLVDDSTRGALGLDGFLALGWRDRGYDSPFENRDERGLAIGPRLRASWAEKVQGTLRYTYERIRTGSDPEVVLLDEVALGGDATGDGIVADDARAVTPVDRSRVEHSVGVGVELELSPSVRLEAGIVRTFREFASDGPLDFDHTEREDIRDEFTLTLRFRISKGWDGRFGWEWREQHSDRPDNPGGTGDFMDYKRNLFLVNVVYRW